MNILFLYSNSIIPQRGGVQRVTSVLADELECRGYRTFYISLPQRRLDEDDKNRQFYLPDSEFFTKQNSRFLEEFVISHEVDFIINQDGFSKGAVNLLGDLKAPCPIFSVLHNSPLAKILNFSVAFRPRLPKLLRPFLFLSDIKMIKFFILHIYKLKYWRHYKKLFSVSDCVVLLSESFKKEVEFFEKSPRLLEKICAIHNPCTLYVAERPVFSEKKNHLLYVGRIELGQKRVDLLIDIWSRIFEKFSDWTLVVVGEGPDLKLLEARVRELQLPRVVFTGRQNPSAYYEQAKIFCMTSSYEGFGLVLVEAMNFGCVPVAFNSFASVVDIIEDSKTGMLVSPFDCEAYADSVANLMKNEELRATLAKNGKEVVAQKFSLAHIVDCWESLFREYPRGGKKKNSENKF